MWQPVLLVLRPPLHFLPSSNYSTSTVDAPAIKQQATAANKFTEFTPVILKRAPAEPPRVPCNIMEFNIRGVRSVLLGVPSTGLVMILMYDLFIDVHCAL